MKSTIRGMLAGVASLWLCAAPCLAHGGQYRPPRPMMVVPPGSAPPPPPSKNPVAPRGRPTTPGPSTPVPTPSAPGSPTAVPAAAQTGSRGVAPEEDFTRWTHWWEYNKDAYLLRGNDATAVLPETGSDDFYLGATRGKDAPRPVRAPTDRDIEAMILPALKHAIDTTDNREIATAGMIALAKIGRDHADFALLDVFQPHLRRGDQEVRETAAIAIGIAGIDGERERGLLLALAGDLPKGRLACDKEHVDPRTRAFAAYGLGLLAYRSQALATRFQVAKELEHTLAAADTDRDLAVAAIQGLSLLTPRPDRPGERALAGSIAAALEAFFTARKGPSEQLVQAHCATAIARLCTADDPHADHYRELFTAALPGSAERSSPDLARAAALALGRLCRGAVVDADAKSTDRAAADALLSTWQDHKDQQTRSFAMIALGQIGGTRSRDLVLREFDRANKTQEKPWCALALGLCERGRQQALRRSGQLVSPDPLVADTLRDAFADSRTPDLKGALAIALGLAGIPDAGDAVRAQLGRSLGQEELAGHLCIGLALLQCKGAADEIREVLRLSLRRPELMRQSAIALGHLGDARAADELHTMLREDEPVVARLAAIAQALGYVGDRRSLQPLIDVLAADDMTKLSRAFAAAALGGIADKEPRVWNSKFAIGIDYRAIVPTLTDQLSGVLDIL